MNAPAPTAPTALQPSGDGIGEGRRLLLFVVVLLTSLGGLGVALGFPAAESDGAFAYETIADDRSGVWAFLALAGVNLVIGVCALAVAGLVIVTARGARWATVGSLVMFLGAASYGVGLGGWSTALFVTTDPVVLDGSTSTALFDAFQDDGVRMWLAAGAGAGLVALGTVLLAVGLWRSGRVPRWVPIVAGVSIVATFLLPTSGAAGLLTEGPVAVSSVAIGWYAWRGRASA